MDIGIGTWKENGRELLKSSSRGDEEKLNKVRQTPECVCTPLWLCEWQFRWCFPEAG